MPIKGAPPSLLNKPSGCAFHPRCPFARVPGVCNETEPPLHLVGGAAHTSACHFAEDLKDVGVQGLRDEEEEAPA